MAFTSTNYAPPSGLNGSLASSTLTSLQNKGSNLVWCPVRNNTEPGDDSYLEFLETAQFVTGLLIYPIFCFPGLVGNVLTVIVLSRRNMLTSTNAFLSALAVSDSIKLFNDILYFFVILFLRTDPPLGNKAHGYLYPYAHFVFNMSVCVSSWLTVSVAVERYILVCMPTRARAVWSRRRAVMLCTMIYFVMTSLALPSFFRYRTIHCLDRNTSQPRLDVELTELWKNDSFVIVYTWAQNLIRSIIPLLILVVLNTCIIYVLSHTKARRRRNSRHRVTVMMIVVILAFLICITPDAILSTVFGFGYYEASNLTRAIREITDTLLTINAAINFLIYCAFNQVFRKSFAQLCYTPKRNLTSGVGWVTEMDESTYRRLSEAQTGVTTNNNYSPRLLETPPTTVSDQSPAFFPPTPPSKTGSPKFPRPVDLSDGGYCDDGGDPARVYDSNQQEQSQFQRLLANGTEDSINSLDHEEEMKQLQQHQRHQRMDQRRYNHDPRRTSSYGLTKSKNSLKRGRNARGSSVRKKNKKPTEVVTYIPSGSSFPLNRFSRRSKSQCETNPKMNTPPHSETHAAQHTDTNTPIHTDVANTCKTSDSNTCRQKETITCINSDENSSVHSETNTCQHADANPSRNSDTSLTYSTSSQAADEDVDRKSNTSNAVPQSAMKETEKSYEHLVFKEHSEVSPANENIPRNNLPSSAYKDNVHDDKLMDTKNLNVNLINNDLSSINSILAPKNGHLKESNIRGQDREPRANKKVAMTVSFSDDSTI